MPVRRAVPAIGARLATFIMRPPGPALASEGDGEAAKLGRSSEVDRHRPFPAIEPFDVAGIDGVGFENAGIVDEDVDAPAHFCSALCQISEGTAGSLRSPSALEVA